MGVGGGFWIWKVVLMIVLKIVDVKGDGKVDFCEEGLVETVIVLCGI